MVFAIGICLGFLFRLPSPVAKILSVPCIASFCYAIWLANSRGGILALGATTVFFFVMRAGKIKGLLYGAPLAMAALVFAPSRAGTIAADDESHRAGCCSGKTA